MNDFKKADNFFRDDKAGAGGGNDLSLSLEASFRNNKDADNGDDVDFGGFLNDPDDLNM